MEKISLRQKLALVVFVICATWLMTGCSVSWVTESENIINSAVPAALGLLSLLSAFNGSLIPAAWFTDVQTVAKDVISDLQNTVLPLIQSYNNATQDQQPGILAEIQDAVNAAAGKLDLILSDLQIKDPALKAKITAIVTALKDELISLAAMIPVVGGNSSMQSVVAKGQMPFNGAQLAKHINALVAHGTGNPELDTKIQAAFPALSPPHGKA